MPNIEYLQKQLELTENCPNECTKVRFRRAINSVKMFKKQCVRCGVLVGDWIPHAEIVAPDLIEPIDDDLRKIYLENALSLRAEIVKVAAEKERKEFFENYDEYLKSEKWNEKRKAVLRRNFWGNCEGCGVNPSTQVHHLTYDHVYDEFLFELVGLCKNCHDRLHQGSKDDE
jgi:hypothetical protein